MTRFSVEEIIAGLPSQKAQEAWLKRKTAYLSVIRESIKAVPVYHRWSKHNVERRRALAWQIVEAIASQETYSSKEELVGDIISYSSLDLEEILQNLKNKNPR